jgi:hypothetical protein
MQIDYDFIYFSICARVSFTLSPALPLSHTYTLVQIDRSFQFLTDCRPHSVSMGNAKQFLRGVIRSLAPDLSEVEAKREVCAEVDRFIRERIEVCAGSLFDFQMSPFFQNVIECGWRGCVVF